MGFFKKNGNILLTAFVVIAALYYFKPDLFSSFKLDFTEGMCGAEHFCGCEGGCNGGCLGDNEIGYPYGTNDSQPGFENFSSCYQRKQIYLNSCDPDEPSGHGDVTLEKRFGKFYINIICNLPYAKGGVMNTMWGAYHAYLVDTRTQKSINIGSLVRHGDRFYKLATELLGEYSNYNELVIYRQSEDYAPKKVLTGSITGQNCSSL